MYSMCKNREEAVTHTISECSKLVQLEYKKRHDKVTGAVHWSLCETYNTSRNVTTLRFDFNAYHAVHSICLGLFVLSLLRILFACARGHVVW